MPPHPTSVRLTESTEARLDAFLAKSRAHASRSALVEEAVARYLDAQEAPSGAESPGSGLAACALVAFRRPTLSLGDPKGWWTMAAERGGPVPLEAPTDTRIIGMAPGEHMTLEPCVSDRLAYRVAHLWYEKLAGPVPQIHRLAASGASNCIPGDADEGLSLSHWQALEPGFASNDYERTWRTLMLRDAIHVRYPNTVRAEVHLDDVGTEWAWFRLWLVTRELSRAHGA